MDAKHRPVRSRRVVERVEVSAGMIVRHAVVDLLTELLPPKHSEPKLGRWVCGTCGCLCVGGETCPACRADLMRRRRPAAG